MDAQTGRLQWEPSMNELDFHSLKIEVSDRHESRMIEADFFVNAPVRIFQYPLWQLLLENNTPTSLW